MKFPNINPEIIHLFGPFSLNWYSLPYLLGFLLSHQMVLKRENKENPFIDKDKLENVSVCIFLSLIAGARLFYILFYNFHLYFKHPIKAFYIWEGGLSFYGGFFGTIIGTIFFTKKYKISSYKILDNISIIIPICLFFGRIANFVNSELYGRPTNLPIGVIFPTDPNRIPRHPSQLYESIFEGPILFIILYIISKKTKVKKIPFLRTLLAVYFYSFIRFFIEFFREPDLQIGFIAKYYTLGQFFCLIFFLISQFLIVKILIKNKNLNNV